MDLRGLAYAVDSMLHLSNCRSLKDAVVYFALSTHKGIADVHQKSSFVSSSAVSVLVTASACKTNCTELKHGSHCHEAIVQLIKPIKLKAGIV